MAEVTSDAAYMRAYRARNATYRERAALVSKARSRALEALATRHAAEFAELCRAARRELGVPAPGDAAR